MTKIHGPDAYVVLLNDGGAIATVGPFKEREDADAFISREIRPERSRVQANVYPLSAPSGIFINYTKTRKQDD